MFKLPKVIRVEQRLLWPNYESGKAGVGLSKADLVLGEANGVSWVASGLPGLA
jgi:hypothetical protein